MTLHDGYGRRILRGGLLGLLFGLLLGLPVGLWFASPWTSRAGPLAPGWNLFRGVSACQMVGLFGFIAGMAMAHASRTFPGSRGLLLRYALTSGAIGTGIGAMVVATTFYFLRPSGPLARQIEFALVLVLSCILGALAFGLQLGTIAAQRDEERRQAELRRRLDAERTDFEAAVERRFGPLDDARRAAIQAWDADRLTEARRKLDDARSVEELDA